MSEKLINFLNSQPKKTFLNESIKVDGDDKEMLYHYISHPGNRTYVLKTYSDVMSDDDRTVVISRKSGTLVTVIVYNELLEVIDFIVEMCDRMGWNFHSAKSNDRIVFEIFVNN
jgi:hypothetical protein